MPLTILLAEDNETDVMLLRRAIARFGSNYQLQVVEDGEEVLSYLQAESAYADRSKFPFPDYLVLDLKMPRKTGFDVLRWLERHPECFVIPTIVFTASAMDEDVELAYHLGANSYFVKPIDFRELVDLFQSFFQYWDRAKRPKHPLQERCGNLEASP